VVRKEADSVIVITGAGSGIGRALSQSLSAKRHRVALAGRREERLLGTRAACVAEGAAEGSVLVLPVDLTEAGSAEYVVQQTLDTFGRIDALINNAGLARFAMLEQVRADDVEAMVRTNLLAPMLLIRSSVGALRQTRGVVVNVGSIGGLLALPGRSLYGATKAALHHLTRSLALELAPDIRVNAVLPGAVDTEMYEDLGLGPAEVEVLRANLLRTTPLGRMGTPEDVVPWIELLVGPAGRWVTGSLMVVDGGRAC
jgi:NAD(P)-dependent dehydrogenase (short-subunit alcohol dehydrogenase family)